MKAKKQVDRKAIIVSAVLTVLLLTGVTSAVLASNWLTGKSPETQGAAQPAAGQVPILVTVEPIFDASAGQTVAAAAQVGQAIDNSQLEAAYQAQLDQAYQALQEAYAQIDALQTSQAPTSGRAHYEDDHDEAGEHEHDSASIFAGNEHDDD